MASVHSTRSQNRIKPDDMQPAIPAPIDLFLPVTLYIPPAPVSHVEEVPTDLPTSTEYSVAMSRIDASQSYLTPSMAATLKALLSVVHPHLSPLNTHSLVQLVASASTTDAKLVELATTIDAGLKAFLARRGPTASASVAGVSPAVDPPVVNTQDQPITPTGGPSLVPSPSASRVASSTRSQRVYRGCVQRDRRICQLTNQADSGVMSHTIPFSEGHRLLEPRRAIPW